MKKIFYIILVIVILFAIGLFVKQQAPQQPEAQIEIEEVGVSEAIETPEDSSAEMPEVNVENAEELSDGEFVGVAPVADVEDVANEAVPEVAPESENDGAEEVEEINPEETSDEDETIVQE